MITHTPGPWQIDCRDNTAPMIIREPSHPVGSLDEWLAVAELFGPSDVREANARLIVAAPELLAALEALLKDNKELGAISRPVANEARAAIAKAKGLQ